MTARGRPGLHASGHPPAGGWHAGLVGPTPEFSPSPTSRIAGRGRRPLPWPRPGGHSSPAHSPQPTSGRPLRLDNPTGTAIQPWKAHRAGTPPRRSAPAPRLSRAPRSNRHACCPALGDEPSGPHVPVARTSPKPPARGSDNMHNYTVRRVSSRVQEGGQTGRIDRRHQSFEI